MRLQAFALSSLALVLLLAATPSASACHPPPTSYAALCNEWQDPPFGLVPHAEGCVENVKDVYRDHCAYALDTTWEVLYGCPNSSQTFLCSVR